MNEFLQSIPAAASSPYAFVAYAISAILFLLAGSRLRMTKMLLGKIQTVPEAERRRALEIASGTVLPTNITAEQWIRNNRLRWSFLFLGSFLIAGLTVSTLAVVRVKVMAEEAGKGLVFVRGTVTRGEKGIPTLDLTLRNESQKVAVITGARITVLDRWHIGPIWVRPMALPVSYTYDVKLPGEKRGVVDVDLSQELRPQTADRFVLRLGPGEGDWYPPAGLFIYVLQVELRYNEQHRIIKLPIVFTHVPPPNEMEASFNPGPSDAELKMLLSNAISAQKEIPPGGIVDEPAVKALNSWVDGLQKEVAKRSGDHQPTAGSNGSSPTN